LAEDRAAVSRNQAKRAVSGRTLEDNVKMILNSLLNTEDIYAMTVGEIESDKNIESREQILEYIKVRFPNDCEQSFHVDLPDTDILILYRKEDNITKMVKWYILAIVSCKVSFHARETEATFWAVILQYHKIRIVLVTEDADRYNVDIKKRHTELATCEKPNSARRRLETFTDKIYVIKKYSADKGYNLAEDINNFYNVLKKMQPIGYRSLGTKVFDDYEFKPHCGYCNKVRPFDDIISDIMNWKFERIKY
jgi:BsaWI restriction endonuclease type 2